MSRNYDNWERLVAAVLKRELLWQLGHQNSISTISSNDYSSRSLDLSFRSITLNSHTPVSLGSIAESLEFKKQLKDGKSGRTILAQLAQDLQNSDQQLYLEAGAEVVTKVLKGMKLEEEEFEQRMKVLGNCRHENVGIPWAYYHFSETTKLIVYDYYSKGSVFDMLQGNKESRPNWESRLKIAVGAARGVAHIHKQCRGELSHGNIKASNIFVNSQGYGCVSDFGVVESSQKSDVYSFGQLLLQIFTRESTRADSTADLLSSLEPHEWTFSCPNELMVDELDMLLARYSILIDLEIRYSPGRKGLERMLEVAKMCLVELEQDRPTMHQVLFQLEKIEEGLNAPRKNHLGKKKPLWHRYIGFTR